MLTLQSRQEGCTVIVNAAGKITFDDVRPLNDLLQKIYAKYQPKALVLNLAEVHQVDSSGIGLLVASRNAMNRRMGQLYLCGLRPPVKTVMEKMNLLTYFSVCATEGDALRETSSLSLFEAEPIPNP